MCTHPAFRLLAPYLTLTPAPQRQQAHDPPHRPLEPTGLHREEQQPPGVGELQIKGRTLAASCVRTNPLPLLSSLLQTPRHGVPKRRRRQQHTEQTWLQD